MKNLLNALSPFSVSTLIIAAETTIFTNIITLLLSRLNPTLSLLELVDSLSFYSQRVLVFGVIIALIGDLIIKQRKKDT